MKYQFPHVTHIDAYLKAIASAEEFIVKRDTQSGILIINYMFASPTTFPDPMSFSDPSEALDAALRRECRGLEFDIETGEMVTRKFQKFFNVNEKPETHISAINWSEPHLVLIKEDGSMLTPFLRKDGVREWHTKMGATDVALPVNKFVASNDGQYNEFCDEMHAEGLTPIFEWCSRQQRIVVDYPVDSLILTAIRSIKTGDYISYSDMQKLGKKYNIPVVRALKVNINNIQEFLDDTRDVIDMEGYVIRFNTGHQCKVKGEWYCQIHRTKDDLSRERNLWALILEDKIDDLKPMMEEADRIAVEKFAIDLDSGIASTAHRLARIVTNARVEIGNDKKRFALEYATLKDVAPFEKGLMFSIWDGKNPLEVVRDFVKKNTGSQTKVDAIRGLVGGISWDRYYKPIVMDN